MHDDLTLPDTSDESLLRAAFATDESSLALLETTLGADQPRQRVLALRGLARRDAITSTLWLSALQDSDVDVRREALTLIAQSSPDDDLLPLVRAALDDDDALVVDAAAFALGEFVDEGAVEELCRVAASHEDARCRESAIAALGAIGDDRARAVIIGALDDKPPVRRRAIVALANYEGPDIEAALERASEDRDWQVRAAVSQLGREADED